jgi:hypothetical protein
MNSYVYAIAISDEGTLYAGGWFTTAGGVAANYIAQWDGGTWHALGPGIGGGGQIGVWSLTFDKNDLLYVGGSFATAGSVSANNIATWDGTSWGTLGSGADNPVYAITFDDSGALYAGGTFLSAGGISAKYIAKWNGISWSKLGSGLSGVDNANIEVNSLVLGNNHELFAGGVFTTAGNKISGYLAKYLTSVCGDGIVEGLEQCEKTGNSWAACCDTSTCTFKDEAVVCRASTGTCDSVEYCNGLNALCPAEDYTSVNGNICDDSNIHTENDICVNGDCIGEPIISDDDVLLTEEDAITSDDDSLLAESDASIMDDDMIVGPDDDATVMDDAPVTTDDGHPTDSDTVKPDVDKVDADTMLDEDVNQPDETVDETTDAALDTIVDDIDTVISDEPTVPDIDTLKPRNPIDIGCGCTLAF